MYDVVIVGAGPAGSNLARLIGNNYKVLIIDKRDLESQVSLNQTSKCCGGLLAPDAQKMIARLGLSLPKDILVNPQIFAVRTIDLANQLERLYQRYYFNMDRDKFDRWLVSLIPENVERKFNSFFRQYEKITDGYQVHFLQNGTEHSVKTRVIIGADGAYSKVRMFLDKNINIPDKYIAIQECFSCTENMPYYTAIFDEEISNFYSWIIPKENYILLGSALKPRDNPKEKFDLLKSKLKDMGFCFDNSLKTEGAFINRPKKLSHFYIGQENIALIGEAAGAISPSSAEGISYALKTSLYLAQSLNKGIDGFLNRYERRTKDIKINLLGKNLKSPAMYYPPLREFAMKSGFQSIK